MTVRKAFLAGFGTAYLLLAILAGFAMKATIPALNGLGIIYTGLTWPVAMGCVAIRAQCSNVPPQRYARWLFTAPSS